MTTDDQTHRDKMRSLQKAQDEKRRQLRDPDRGLIIINTGDGKGKSSSAFGVIARALGWGHRVAVVQFIKGKWQTGEKQFFARFNDQVSWHVMGDGFTWNTQDRSADTESAQAALNRAGELIACGDYQLVVLDEINIALRYQYLTPDEVIAVLERRVDTSVLLTGRDAPQELIDIADTVTEMRAVKHAYQDNIRAQQGIDF